MKIELINLYNGIHNDYSIQRYSIGWSNVCETIEKFSRKPIEKNTTPFTKELLTHALNVSGGKLKKQISCFAKELNFNIQTIHEKR